MVGELAGDRTLVTEAGFERHLSALPPARQIDDLRPAGRSELLRDFVSNGTHRVPFWYFSLAGLNLPIRGYGGRRPRLAVMGLFMRSGRSGGNWRCGCSSPKLAAGRYRWRLRPCGCRPVYLATTTTRGWIVGRKGGAPHRSPASLAAYRGEADLLYERIHDLRHTFASRALALGETLPAIGKLLCHNDIQTTARYAHLAWNSVHEAAERIADSIAADLL